MANTAFMLEVYSLKELIAHYLEEIKNLRPYVKTPQDETKLQTYYQAVETFNRVTMKDLVQFALSLGREGGGMTGQMRAAFPIILGNRVITPTQIDIAYARLLLAYTKTFKQQRSQLKDWLLRFIISSRFSPLTPFFDREIASVIENTERNIIHFEQGLR